MSIPFYVVNQKIKIKDTNSWTHHEVLIWRNQPVNVFLPNDPDVIAALHWLDANGYYDTLVAGEPVMSRKGYTKPLGMLVFAGADGVAWVFTDARVATLFKLMWG